MTVVEEEEERRVPLTPETLTANAPPNRMVLQRSGTAAPPPPPLACTRTVEAGLSVMVSLTAKNAPAPTATVAELTVKEVLSTEPDTRS